MKDIEEFAREEAQNESKPKVKKDAGKVFLWIIAIIVFVCGGFWLVNNIMDAFSPQTKPVTIVRSEEPQLTMEQSNAIRMAKEYLRHSAFSYNGLVDQLEFEGFEHDDAVFAADNCGADWSEEAAECAKSYLRHSAFSKQGLIEQLEFEGFTHEQALYGVEQNGY